jgi:hypothetical protein
MKRPRPGIELTDVERCCPLLADVVNQLESVQASEALANPTVEDALSTVRFVLRTLSQYVPLGETERRR